MILRGTMRLEHFDPVCKIRYLCKQYFFYINSFSVNKQNWCRFYIDCHYLKKERKCKTKIYGIKI